MHIGILRTDSVRPEWVPTYGEYPDMFERLLLAEDDTLTFTTWNVEAGELPDSVEAADGFLITGSKSSVYDDKEWIRALEGFVRECHAARRKVARLAINARRAGKSGETPHAHRHLAHRFRQARVGAHLR